MAKLEKLNSSATRDILEALILADQSSPMPEIVPPKKSFGIDLKKVTTEISKSGKNKFKGALKPENILSTGLVLGSGIIFTLIAKRLK